MSSQAKEAALCKELTTCKTSEVAPLLAIHSMGKETTEKKSLLLQRKTQALSRGCCGILLCHSRTKCGFSDE